MTRGEEIRTAIQRRDTATLRRMADEARRQEDRAFLALLAEFVDQYPGPRTQLITAAQRPPGGSNSMTA